MGIKGSLSEGSRPRAVLENRSVLRGGERDGRVLKVEDRVPRLEERDCAVAEGDGGQSCQSIDHTHDEEIVESSRPMRAAFCPAYVTSAPMIEEIQSPLYSPTMASSEAMLNAREEPSKVNARSGTLVSQGIRYTWPTTVSPFTIVVLTKFGSMTTPGTRAKTCDAKEKKKKTSQLECSGRGEVRTIRSLSQASVIAFGMMACRNGARQYQERSMREKLNPRTKVEPESIAEYTGPSKTFSPSIDASFI